MTVATYPGGGSAATKSWKYQGRLDVAASGPSLYDFAAREMSPGLGSFTSNDTVLGSATNPRQLNRYVYRAPSRIRNDTACSTRAMSSRNGSPSRFTPFRRGDRISTPITLPSAA